MLKPEKVIKILKRYQQHQPREELNAPPSQHTTARTLRDQSIKGTQNATSAENSDIQRLNVGKEHENKKTNREQAHIEFAARTTTDRPSHQSWVIDMAATISMFLHFTGRTLRNDALFSCYLCLQCMSYTLANHLSPDCMSDL